MPLAARVTDQHVCPASSPTPHGGGPIQPPGSPDVIIDNQPAARVGDMAICTGAGGAPAPIVKGSNSVQINNMPAARLGDPTAHGGVIVMGSPTVFIDDIRKAVKLEANLEG
jgi:uncharacterized Zn-binding protein involved in type VI secretion